MLSNTTTNLSISFLKNDFLVWFLCVVYSCFLSVMSAFSQKKEKKSVMSAHLISNFGWQSGNQLFMHSFY